jgi:C4-dicarboxylate transporter DctQ subunit
VISGRIGRYLRLVIDGAAHLSTAALIVGAGINFANIIGRYFFHASIEWAEEVMLYLMLASVFLGGAAASLRGAHISMDIVLKGFSPRGRRVLGFINDAIFLAVAATVIWLAVPVIAQLIEFDQRSEAARIPVAYPQMLIPIGFLLMAIGTILRRFDSGESDSAQANSEPVNLRN